MAATSKIKNNRNLFFSGVAVLTFTNVLNKVIGMLFRIPISNILGDSGMAYFNAAYHIFVWFYMISTGGLPLAVSILVSEARFKGNREEIKKIYSLTMKMFVAIGLVGTAIMVILSRQFAELNKVAGSYLSIIAVAPTLFLVCVSSAMRGYFQGFQEMRPTAVSQVMETVGKLLMGILLALGARSLGYGLEVQAACAIAGLTIGTAFGMLFLFISKLRFREEEYAIDEATGDSRVSGGRTILRRLLVIAVPITISSSIMSLTTMIDDVIINRRLISIGYVEEYANALYGNYTGFAVPFANLPPALIYPISYSLIPMLKGTLTLGDSKRSREICRSCLRVTAIVALPCTLGVCVLSEPLLKLLYNAESSELAAPKLSVLAISIFFICMLSISNAILQAYGRQNKPIISLALGSVVKIILSYVLIGIPAINIFGAPISTVVCYIICTVLNVYFMAKYTDVRPSVFITFVKPLIASAVCIGGAFGVTKLLGGHMPGKAVILVAIAAAAVIYVLALFAIRGVERDDILMLPKGEKIYSLLHKVRLVK